MTDTRLGESMPVFTAYSRATGEALHVDRRTFDPALHRKDEAQAPETTAPKKKAQS